MVAAFALLACAAPRAHGAADCFRATPDSLAADDCWYTLHIHAVRVTDCCSGVRAADISARQVAQWVEKANEAYQVARVRFEFDPTPQTGDWDAVKSTEINQLVAALPGDPVWEQGKAAANELARHYPGKVLVFFRRGPGATPTGGGFSSDAYDFVVMPEFDATTVCGIIQNIQLFAHELGHYLGLNHTFREFETKAEAAEALRDSKFDARVFDGDRIKDTLPEPYIKELQCSRDESVTLAGVPFPLLRSNVMSYYVNDTKTITPQQAEVVRRTIRRRFADANDGVGPYVPDKRRAYQLVSFESGRVLEAGAASAGNVADVRLAEWIGGAGQAWKVVPLTAQDAGWFEIVSVATGKCLTVGRGESGDGLIQAPWAGADGQKWRFLQKKHGVLRIEATRSGTALTVSTTPAASRALLGTAPDRGGKGQRWRLLPAD